MSLPGTNQWPNVVMPPAEAVSKGIGLEEEANRAFKAFWDEVKREHRQPNAWRQLPTCASVAGWLFRTGYKEGRKP